MAVFKCKLEVEPGKLIAEWKPGTVAKKLKVGDTIQFISEYGSVNLIFFEDNPFLKKPIQGYVTYTTDGKKPLSLKVETRKKKTAYKFLCLPASPLPTWTKGVVGDDVPKDDPPG